MKLVKVLEIVNQIEKSSFFKILDSLSETIKESDGITLVPDGGSKCVNDACQIKALFDRLSALYQSALSDRIDFDPQLLLLANIVVRDGHSILERNWLEQLYKKEHAKLAEQVAQLQEISPENIRFRDYRIFRACVREAYGNDERNNHDCQVTRDEKSILNVLAKEFEFSHAEMLMLYAAECPIEVLDIDALIGLIKEAGIGFYSRKNFRIYIPDEIIVLLRKILNIDLPNKYFRRILKQLQTAQLNPVITSGEAAGGNSGATQRMDLGIAVKQSSGDKALSLEELLSRYMEMRVFNIFNPYPASELARRFDEFRTVHYELEEDGKKVSCTADILDLPRLYAEHEECRLLPSDKVGELALLLHASPLLVMDQLRACADALNDIGRLSQRESQEKLSSSVAAVEKRLALSLLVESELERVEQEYLPLKRNYPEFFDNAVDTGDVLTQDGEEFLDARESLLTGR